MRKANTPPVKGKRTNNIKREDFSLLDIRAKTEAQRMMRGFLQGQNVVAYDSAGLGKSFIACYLALKDLQEKQKNKIVQVPYINIVNEICQNGAA